MMFDLSQLMLHKADTHMMLLPLESTFVPRGANSFPPRGSKAYTAHPLSYDLSPGPHLLDKVKQMLHDGHSIFTAPLALLTKCFMAISPSL